MKLQFLHGAILCAYSAIFMFVSVGLCKNIFLYQFENTKLSLHIWELLRVNKIFLKNLFLITFAGRYITSKWQGGHKGPRVELRQ